MSGTNLRAAALIDLSNQPGGVSIEYEPFKPEEETKANLVDKKPFMHLSKTQRHSNEQGWRSGESARLPPMCPGFDSRTRRHMWVEFVVGSLLCSERFFSGYSGFPLSSKTNTSKFQFDLETVDEEPPRGNATANPIIIIIIIIINEPIS